MNATPALFPTCPLPGCANLTGDPRTPCRECLTAFGDMLRPGGPQVSADEFTAAVAERDEDVQKILAARREMSQLHQAPPPEPAAEWRPNQRCWVCEERRKCRRDPERPERWICRECLQVH